MLLGQHEGLAWYTEGEIHRKHAQYEKALDSYNKALDILKEHSDLKNVDAAIIINNIGDAYEHMNQLDKALPYYEKSRETQKLDYSCSNGDFYGDEPFLRSECW